MAKRVGEVGGSNPEFSSFLNPSTRLNMLVECVNRVGNDDRAKHTIATGTHDKNGGRVFKVRKQYNKVHVSKSQKETTTTTTGDSDLTRFNYTTPEDVEYNNSDTDSEIGELTLAELLERDIEELKFDLEEMKHLAGEQDRAMMQAFLDSPLGCNPAEALSQTTDQIMEASPEGEDEQHHIPEPDANFACLNDQMQPETAINLPVPQTNTSS